MFCGPRDQTETWQALPSATPSNRFFGFSHVLDGGWTGDHYCRSWELLGLHQYGPIVNVDAPVVNIATPELPPANVIVNLPEPRLTRKTLTHEKDGTTTVTEDFVDGG